MEVFHRNRIIHHKFDCCACRRLAGFMNPTASVNFFLSATLLFLAVFKATLFQQLNLTKCSRSSHPAPWPPPRILPLKLLFAQPSMEAAQTQMEADAMDDWFSRQPEKAKTKWGPHCWQEKYNNPAASKAYGYLKADDAILKSNSLNGFISVDSSGRAFLADHSHKILLLVLFSPPYCWYWPEL